MSIVDTDVFRSAICPDLKGAKLPPAKYTIDSNKRWPASTPLPRKNKNKAAQKHLSNYTDRLKYLKEIFESDNYGSNKFACVCAK